MMASGLLRSLTHPPGVVSPLEPHGRERPHLSFWPRLLTPRRSRRYPSRPTATAPSPWEVLLYGFPRQLTHRLSPRPTWTPSTQLPKFSSVIPQCTNRAPMELENN